MVCDAASGQVVREGRASHPDLTEVDARVWWQAFTEASSGLMDGVEAIAVGARQHGMVLFDDVGNPVRDALLWNDNRSSAQAVALLDELGGPQAWVDATGLVPVASFTVTKLRWVAEREPDIATSASGVMLPHDWITHQLRGATGEPTTDRGDASGTGYWSAGDGAYRFDLLKRAFGRELQVPRVAKPCEAVGETPTGVLLAPGTGDNMAAALGLTLEVGDVVVSLGTSGTVFAVSEQPAADPSGVVAGFADATGRFLPLVCTLNAARVVGAGLQMVGAELDDLDRLVLSVDDTRGLVLLPFLDGERTPPLPDASGLLYGLTRATATPAHLVRAAVEGMICALAEAVAPLRVSGVTPQRIVLIGGAARSTAVRRLAAGLFGLPVAVPDPGEYVARGAARQAAWTLTQDDAPPPWESAATVVAPDDRNRDYYARVRATYSSVLAEAQPLLTRQSS